MPTIEVSDRLPKQIEAAVAAGQAASVQAPVEQGRKRSLFRHTVGRG